MAWKTPTIYLTNGRNHFCSLCHCDVLLEETQFEMKHIGGKKPILVSEMILCCPSCHRLYITQAMSRELVAKFPGYYVNTSMYDLKPSKRRKPEKQPNEGNAKTQASPASSMPIQPNKKETNFTVQVSTSKHIDSTIGLTAQIYLTNTYSSAHNICPLCSSVLGKERVNIPVIEANGDFYRYYSDVVHFCYKCRKAYITKETVATILHKVNESIKTPRTIKLENVTINKSDSRQDYLFSPTLGNSYAIYFPGADYQKASSAHSYTMELNAQSFLGEMGYSVNKAINVRRHILLQAIEKYGKRKVVDHLAFLIATRKGQVDGATKYANAIRIWQDDINYISEV